MKADEIEVPYLWGRNTDFKPICDGCGTVLNTHEEIPRATTKAA